jgi:uncharacterized membrane protein SpoIIM required for sporulation
MDYPSFVRNRQERWQELAASLAALGSKQGRRQLGYARLERLVFDYRRLLHDLAWAEARFPGSAVVQRLRALALAATRSLVPAAVPPRRGLLAFFAQTFPAAVERRRQELGVAASLFLATALLGIVGALASPGLGLTFLGPGAVEGLEEGRLWTDALATSVPPAVSSSRIATNNLGVALAAWAGGAFAGLGTLWILVLNGLLLGSMVATTLHYGLAGGLLAFISAHGPLELTVIVFAGGGGLVLARSLVASDERPRRRRLEEEGRDALTLLGGCLPWLVPLAAVEAWISPAPALGVGWKLAIGLALETLFLLLAFRRPAAEESP